MAGFENDVLLCSNVNFNPALSKPHTGLITTNGQLIIGSTALNAGGTHLNIGVLTSPDSSISIGYSSPNITLQSGSKVGTNFPTDDGTAIPSLGVLKILGSSSTDYTQSGLVTHSDGTSNEIYLENRLWQTKFVVDSSATIGDRGSYQTITAATAAASSGDAVFIRGGTYTEDFTPKDGVSYFGFGSGNVTIIGKVSINQDGNYYFQDLTFETNNDYAIELTGVNHPITAFSRCNFTGSNHTILNLSTAFGGTDFENCFFDLTTTGIAHFVTNNSGPATRFGYSVLENSAGSSTANVNSGLPITFNWAACKSPLQSTINGTWNIANSILNTFATNSTALDILGTGLNGDLNFVTIASGSGVCVNIDTGCAIKAVNCCFATNGAFMVTGGGTFSYAGITNGGSNQTAAISATTNTPLEWLPYGTAAASAASSYRGTASFDSSDFSVTDGFVTLNGSGAGQTITGQSGGALAPTAGNWNIYGASTAAGTSPVSSSGSGSTLTLNVQKSQALASTDATKIGLANFDSARFTCDANGFVSINGSGVGETITGQSGGALSPSSGNWNISGANGIITSGSGSTLTVTTQSLPTVQILTSGTGATYTTPTGCKWIWVRAWGGGGGGAGSGTSPGAPTNGANTTFSAGSMVAGYGASGGGAQGASSGGNIANYSGATTTYSSNVIASLYGGAGGSTSLGGAGGGGNNAPSAGTSAQSNSGGGGGGAGCGATVGAGIGGWAGGYCESLITSPAASYTYTIGAGGTGGTAGTSGAAGGNGGSGLIIVVEGYI